MVSRFIAAFLSAWFSLQFLNSHKTTKRQPSHKTEKDNNIQRHEANIGLDQVTTDDVKSAVLDERSPLVAGKTIDLTILAIARAIDATFVNLWRSLSPHPDIKSPKNSVLLAASHHTDTLVFALSSGTVMWAWFYLPDRLPRAYNKWIGEAAQIDDRLIEMLREARAGQFVYGKDTGHSHVLQGMCKKYKLPSEWGDPAKTIPIPCEIVHMGIGPSCHWHAAVRFVQAFEFALATNLPLQILLKAREASLKALGQACQEAVRSSAFLGAFVGLFYYGVCISRTCLGPKLFNCDTVSPMMWDSGLCIGGGCFLCGWSILIEAGKRRPELAMFVAPRALGTFVPRKYDVKVSLNSVIPQHRV